MSLRVRDEGFARVFGGNLARARDKLGLSQEELGLRAGLHRTAVSQLERGERVARTDTLVRLCGSLGVGPEALLAGLCWRPTRIQEGELEIEEVEPANDNESTPAKRAKKEREDKTARSSEGQQ
jgi:transcriptional regulator with XRE-family HTH domain